MCCNNSAINTHFTPHHFIQNMLESSSISHQMPHSFIFPSPETTGSFKGRATLSSPLVAHDARH
jgi:hypothetical protein